MAEESARTGRIVFPMRVVAPPPVAPLVSERIQSLDILRGLALFGMIVVHFHQRVNLEAEGLEGLIGWAIWIGLETKSWGSFALLFGTGFAVLLRRMEAQRRPFAAFYLRRMAVLALFGVAVEVLFGFRVLLDYALWGTVLLLLRRLPTVPLLAIAAASSAARPVLSAGAAVGLWPSFTSPEESATASGLRSALDAAARGDSFSALVSARFDWMVYDYLRPSTLTPGVTLTLFILGLLAVRAGVIDAPLRHVRLIGTAMIAGLLSWAVYWLVLYRLPDGWIPGLTWEVRSGFGLLNEQWLTFTLVGGLLLLLAYRPAWGGYLAWAGWSGRMALTNYVLQAAAVDFIASGYGMSLDLRPLLGLAAAAALFSTESVVSRLWLARYRFGPLEWSWRSLTYRERQPMRRLRPAGTFGSSAYGEPKAGLDPTQLPPPDPAGPRVGSGDQSS